MLVKYLFLHRPPPRLINACFFLLLAAALPARGLPGSFCVFRDAVYSQGTALPETLGLYTAAKEDIAKSLTGSDRYLALSRCEYLMGLAFHVENRTREAAAFYEQGIARAEAALEQRETSEGYRLLGTSIALLCEVRRSYGLVNFGRIEENAKKALELDGQNMAARYLIGARYVAAPWPLCNVPKGAILLEEIAGEYAGLMEGEELFNLYLMLEAACLKQKQQQAARIWHEKAAALYPGNNFIKLIVK